MPRRDVVWRLHLRQDALEAPMLSQINVEDWVLLAGEYETDQAVGVFVVRPQGSGPLTVDRMGKLIEQLKRLPDMLMLKEGG